MTLPVPRRRPQRSPLDAMLQQLRASPFDSFYLTRFIDAMDYAELTKDVPERYAATIEALDWFLAHRNMPHPSKKYSTDAGWHKLVLSTCAWLCQTQQWPDAMADMGSHWVTAAFLNALSGVYGSEEEALLRHIYRALEQWTGTPVHYNWMDTFEDTCTAIIRPIFGELWVSLRLQKEDYLRLEEIILQEKPALLPHLQTGGTPTVAEKALTLPDGLTDDGPFSTTTP